MSKIKKKKFNIFIIISILIINSFIYSTIFIKTNQSKRNKISHKDFDQVGHIKLSENHSPIIINGNKNFNSTNGVSSGNGTFENPYIIEDFIIDAGGNGSCIFINNTNAYFIIQNCTLINSGTSTNRTTIYFNNVTNGRINNNSISYALVFLYYSNNNTISYNNLYINSSFLIQFSNNTSIFNNSLINGFGIYLIKSTNNELLNNNIETSSNGIFLSLSCNNTIQNNKISQCKSWGISLLQQSNFNDIIKNRLYYNEMGGINIDGTCIGNEVEGNIIKEYKNNGENDDNDDDDDIKLAPIILLFLIIIIILLISTVIVVLLLLDYKFQKNNRSLLHKKKI